MYIMDYFLCGGVGPAKVLNWLLGYPENIEQTIKRKIAARISGKLQ
jgi:hypothetical protein